MRRQLEAQFSQDLETAKRAAAQKLQEEANKRIAQAAAERGKTLEQLEQLQARETEARKQAQEAKASVATLKKNLEQQLESEKQAAQKRGKEEAQKEFAELRTQVTAEREKAVEQLRLLRASEAEAKKQAQQASDSVAALKKTFDQRLEAEKRAAEKRAKEETEAMLKKEMERQRIILQQAHDTDLSKQKSESNKQNDALLKKVQELQHKLEQKTADQLGDGAEVDLYETLRQQFPGDKISRVPKGHAGPDILHWVMYKGETCGQIVYDSKNQQKWMNGWSAKLHQEKIDARADHAILATTVFPAGKKEIDIDASGVILVNPLRAAHIAHLLRELMIAMHVKGLGQKERVGKTNRLYEFIASNEYKQQFDQAESLNEELGEVLLREKKAHEKLWNERLQLLVKQRQALREIHLKVTAIIEAPAVERTPAA